MSKFIKSLSIFMAGVAFNNTKALAINYDVENPFENNLEPVNLRPLNMPGDNLYAAHRSHSSHSSHSSHRSGSGSYSAPSRSNPVPSNPYSRSNNIRPSTGNSESVDSGRPVTVTPSGRDFNPDNQNLMNLIMRVQVALLIKGYSPGAADGIMGRQTRNALKQYQKDNSIKMDGLMSTTTLNSLGVVSK